MSVDIRRFASVIACCASAPAVALFVAAAATADPGTPAVPPGPAPVPAPAAQAEVDNASAPLPVPPDGTPHLASPDALPPGSTMDPSVQANEGPNLSYLKDLWHAVQNQEISGKEALLLGIAQRGMNTPVPNQVAGPNVPLAPEAVPQAAPGAPVPPDAPIPPGEPVPPPVAPVPPPVAPVPAPLAAEAAPAPLP